VGGFGGVRIREPITSIGSIGLFVLGTDGSFRLIWGGGYHQEEWTLQGHVVESAGTTAAVPEPHVLVMMTGAVVTMGIWLGWRKTAGILRQSQPVLTGIVPDRSRASSLDSAGRGE
jgi:hypothetical protein